MAYGDLVSAHLLPGPEVLASDKLSTAHGYTV